MARLSGMGGGGRGYREDGMSTAGRSKRPISGDAAYREPNRICASCGGNTSSARRDEVAGYGDFHE
jgi:hypothetical protein